MQLHFIKEVTPTVINEQKQQNHGYTNTHHSYNDRYPGGHAGRNGRRWRRNYYCACAGILPGVFAKNGARYFPRNITFTGRPVRRYTILQTGLC